MIRETRELRCEIEIREDESRASPGRIVGTLITYGQRARDRADVFAAGALRWPDDGVILNEQHNRRAPILRFTPILEGREVLIDAPLPDTQRGRDAATMIRDRVFRGLSIEFRALEEGRRGGLREVRTAKLLGAALVDDGSYKGQLEVRQRDQRCHGRRLWL